MGKKNKRKAGEITDNQKENEVRASEAGERNQKSKIPKHSDLNKENDKSSNTEPREEKEKEIEQKKAGPVSKVSKSVLIAAGTYERVLYGMIAQYNNTNTKIELTPRFIMPSHIGCISTVSIGEKYLASGSTDEVIKLFDLKRQKELGSLHEHSGSITSLHFHEHSHLLSASVDGKICIYRTKDWEVIKVLKGHSGQVNDIAIHPTGKLAISVGKDRTAIVWNLLTGQKAARTKLNREGEKVVWNSSGTHYAIISSDNSVAVYDVQKGTIISTFQSNQRVLCAVYIENEGTDYLILGGQDKHLRILKGDTEVGTVLAHDNRIKGLSTVNILDFDGNPVKLLVSVSSDKYLKVWDLDDVLKNCINEESKKTITPRGSYNVGCRLTCVSSSRDPLA